MNLLSGRLVDIFIEDGVAKGKVKIGGAFTNVVLTLLPEARVGDTVLVDSGVAIGISSEPQCKEDEHVPRNSR
jgi:hydrogenase maturation factor